MAEAIQAIFIDPPIAIARLGGSSVPQDAFVWVESPDPRADGETAVMPALSLKVLPDGSAEPTMPTEISFRDGSLIRPVCPFFELWALVGEKSSAPETWREVALTPALLAQHGADLSALTIRVDAHNLKAAHRTGNPQLGFGTHPAVEIKGDRHDPVVLHGVSPPGSRPAMIPTGRTIPMASVQILRSGPNSVAAAFKDVDLEIIRLRFTPGRGRFYGPPQAARPTAALPFPAVDSANAFLDPAAGWFNAPMTNVVQPSDTYDGAERRSGRSLGVVDDTCEARIEASLTLRNVGKPLTAAANVFVSPPDFGPDRRPFLSLSDELNDRAADAAARTKAMSPAERDAWIEDLFERVYETVSLLNVDHYRAERGVQLRGDRLAPQLVNDHMPNPEQAMGGRDALRHPQYTVEASSANNLLPLSHHARRQHRAIADLQSLRDFITRMPGRIQQLVRRPFEIESIEVGSRDENDEITAQQTTMRMPPFMRQSNGQPLTLANWQYELLIDWVKAVDALPAAAAIAGTPLAATAKAVIPPKLSQAASERRRAVLARLDASGSDLA
jgi:hypothetical protein